MMMMIVIIIVIIIIINYFCTTDLKLIKSKVNATVSVIVN